MFYKTEDTLIIVCQNESLATQIKDWLNEDREWIIFQDQNHLPKFEVWSEAHWSKHNRSHYISNKVLFLGQIHGTAHLINLVDVVYEFYGIKYGYAENRAIIWIEGETLIKGNDYEAFLAEIKDAPMLDCFKFRKDQLPSKGKIITAVTLDLLLTLGTSSAILFSKSLLENKKNIKDQMLIYGMVKFLQNDLLIFLQKVATKNVDKRTKIIKHNKQIRCPSCKSGTMSINSSDKNWICDRCSYSFSARKTHAFWFCKNCGEYLNNQEGFAENALKHICKSCGYINDTTFDTVRGVCFDCGKAIDPTETLCHTCKKNRYEKIMEKLVPIGIAVGVVAGAVVLAALASGKDEEENNNSCEENLSLLNDVSEDNICWDDENCDIEALNSMNERYFKNCPNCGGIMYWDGSWECTDCDEEIDSDEGDNDGIIVDGGNNEDFDFELANFCRGGDLAED